MFCHCLPNPLVGQGVSVVGTITDVKRMRNQLGSSRKGTSRPKGNRKGTDSQLKL